MVWCEIIGQGTLQWCHYSELIASSGWVGPPCLKKKLERRGARGESTSWSSLHVCLHFPSVWDKLVIFFLFSCACQSCKVSRTRVFPGRLCRWTTKQLIRSLLIAGSHRNMSEVRTIVQSLQRKSKQQPKCFKWITPVCHCNYTLLADNATRWIVFYGFTADLFSFFSFQLEWSPPPSPHFNVLQSEWGICFWLWTTHQRIEQLFEGGVSCLLQQRTPEGESLIEPNIFFFLLLKWYIKSNWPCFVNIITTSCSFSCTFYVKMLVVFNNKLFKIKFKGPNFMYKQVIKKSFSTIN